MRNISFALTVVPFIGGWKDVTRRDGWRFLKVGEQLCAVRKSQGLRKGEKLARIGFIVVTGFRRERLDLMLTDHDYGWDEVRREGFAGTYTPTQFVDFFCESHKGCTPATIVSRIQFGRVKQ